MSQIHLQLPDASLAALGVSAEGAGDRLRLLAAMMLFEKGSLSAGAAAELAGIAKVEFLTRLKDFGVEAFRQGDPDEARRQQDALERSLGG